VTLHGSLCLVMLSHGLHEFSGLTSLHWQIQGLIGFSSLTQAQAQGLGYQKGTLAHGVKGLNLVTSGKLAASLQYGSRRLTVLHL